MAEATNQQLGETALHAASPKIKQKANLYAAEYLGSGTFSISKPQRKKTKRRQSALKGTTRGARK